MTTAMVLQILATVGPVILAIVAWGKLGPERELTAATALNLALERIADERDRLDLRVSSLEARATRLEEQLRGAGLEPVR